MRCECKEEVIVINLFILTDMFHFFKHDSVQTVQIELGLKIAVLKPKWFGVSTGKHVQQANMYNRQTCTM